MEKRNCIMMSGAPKCGKDTATNYIVEHYNFNKYSLGDVVRAVASVMFNLDFSYFHDRDKKEVKIDKWGMSPREILQRIGHDMKHTFFGDIWCRIILNESGIDGDIIISDNRYPDEIEFFEKHFNVIKIRISRKGLDGKKVGIKNHPSEQLDFDYDYLIENNTNDLQDLYRKIDILLMGNGFDMDDESFDKIRAARNVEKKSVFSKLLGMLIGGSNLDE